MPRFSIKEALQFGWQTVRNKLGFFIGLSLVFTLASVVLTPLQTYFSDQPVVSMILAILSIALALIVDLGFMKIMLNTYDKKPADFPDLFRSYDLSPRYFLCTVLYFLLILIVALIPGVIAFRVFDIGEAANDLGIIEILIIALLLLLPIIYFSLKFYFFGYFIIDQEAGPIEALKRSAQLTKGQLWPLFLLFLAILGIILLGFVALFVGLFVAYPVAILTTTYVYRKLLETQEQDV